eukprot:6340064-Amphidinium_carterae.1
MTRVTFCRSEDVDLLWQRTDEHQKAMFNDLHKANKQDKVRLEYIEYSCLVLSSWPDQYTQHFWYGAVILRACACSTVVAQKGREVLKQATARVISKK